MELGHLATTLETIAAAAEIAAARAELQPTLDEQQIAALRAAANALTTGAPAKPSRVASAGTRWDDAEDVRLCAEFDSGMPVPEIAAAHSRSRTAITLRLVKLGRIDPSTVRVRERNAPLV
ncbi:MAG TPA: hypothetical protein VEK79_23275 [Thermoanaerobaculia bacterium]|nr:hypothetical protein [Thermoanaerobaculia bacterium]